MLQRIGALTEVLDRHARALEDLLHVAFTVVLGKASPLGELPPLFHDDNVDVMTATKVFDEQLVASVFAVLGEDAKVGRAAIEGARDLGQPSDEAVGIARLAKHNAKGVLS